MDYLNQAYVKPLSTTSDRFDKARFSLWDIDIYDTLNSFMWNQLSKLPSRGSFTISSEVSRPDIIAYRIYGTVALWWVVMLYNGLSKHEQLIQGMTLNYPSIQDIEALYLSLPAKQAAK